MREGPRAESTPEAPRDRPAAGPVNGWLLIYRGWALSGFVVLRCAGVDGRLCLDVPEATLAGAGRVDVPVYRRDTGRLLDLTAPANQATENWTVLPAAWDEVRRTWEYSHALPRP